MRNLTALFNSTDPNRTAPEITAGMIVSILNVMSHGSFYGLVLQRTDSMAMILMHPERYDNDPEGYLCSGAYSCTWFPLVRCSLVDTRTRMHAAASASAARVEGV